MGIPQTNPVKIYVKYRHHNPGQIARTIDIAKVHPEYVAGVVKGLRYAFNEQDYELDVSEVTQEQTRLAEARAVAPRRE